VLPFFDGHHDLAETAGLKENLKKGEEKRGREKYFSSKLLTKLTALAERGQLRPGLLQASPDYPGHTCIAKARPCSAWHIQVTPFGC